MHMINRSRLLIHTINRHRASQSRVQRVASGVSECLSSFLLPLLRLLCALATRSKEQVAKASVPTCRWITSTRAAPRASRDSVVTSSPPPHPTPLITSREFQAPSCLPSSSRGWTTFRSHSCEAISVHSSCTSQHLFLTTPRFLFRDKLAAHH